MPEPQTATERVALNRQLAQMLKGGVIMDVTTPEQAHIAEEAGACAVMALERIPADIRAAGGVSRMSDPKMIKGIQEAVSIPVMAKCRIGHFVEAQVLQAIEIDYIDESEVLSPADDAYHIDKTQFNVPFVCGARDSGRGAAPHRRGRHDDPHQGRAGHWRRRSGRAPHAHDERRDSPRARTCAQTSCSRPPSSCRCPSTCVRVRARERQAASGELRRRRRGDSGRRRADDAARRRGRVRGLGYLQVRRPRQARRRPS